MATRGIIPVRRRADKGRMKAEDKGTETQRHRVVFEFTLYLSGCFPPARYPFTGALHRMCPLPICCSAAFPIRFLCSRIRGRYHTLDGFTLLTDFGDIVWIA